MPYEYWIDTERRVVRARFSGTTTGEDVRECRRRVSGDPRFSAGMSLLMDWSDVVIDRLTSSDIYSLASTSKLRKGARRAFVVADSAPYGLARMFQTFRELMDAEEETRLFDNLADAERWLTSPDADS